MHYFALLWLSLLQFAAALAVIGIAFMRHNAKRRYAFGAALLLGALTAIFILLFFGIRSASFYNSDYYPLLAASLGTVMLSILLAYSYISRPRLFIGLMFLLIYSFFLYGVMGRFAYGIGIFGVGTAYGLLYRESTAAKTRSERSNINIEVSRDLFQIGLGLAVMLILAFGKIGIQLLFVLIIAAYAMSNSLPSSERISALYNMFRRFERVGSMYGIGAVYMLAGTSMLIGFISNAYFLEASIAILFIGDALATIIGMHFGIARLPYSKKKTIGGFLALAFVGIVSFYIIGEGILLSAALALVVAFVESISLHLDDNITIPAALIILFYALF